MVQLILKLVLLGDGGVGKTSIRRSYMGKGFQKSHLMTIGADFAEDELKFEKNGEEISAKLQIWDLAGQEAFNIIRLRFLSDADCIMVVYDITSMESFHSIPKWMKEAWEVNDSKSLPILIIGNKSDLENERLVPFEALKKFSEKLRKNLHGKVPVSYIETSALTGANIKESFKTLVSSVHDNL